MKRLLIILPIMSMVLTGCGKDNKSPEQGAPETQPCGITTESRPSTMPISAKYPHSYMKLDLGLTADAVTRATPGYSKGIKPPHIRKEVKRPDFMVPSGTKNLALYKTVTCCDKEVVTGDLDQITDGLKKSGDFDFVELGPGLKWIQVDLEKSCTIQAVVVWHYYKNATIYNDVIMQVSNDAAMKENVTTLFNNDHDNSSGLGKGQDTAYFSRWWGEIADARGKDLKGITARYVRVYTASGVEDEPPRFSELAVYGK